MSVATVSDTQQKGRLWRPGTAPVPGRDGVVVTLLNRPARSSSTLRLRFTCVDLDNGTARVAAADERGALVLVDAPRRRGGMTDFYHNARPRPAAAATPRVRRGCLASKRERSGRRKAGAPRLGIAPPPLADSKRGRGER